MQSKEEYLVGIYKIFGLALTAPFGKILLSIPDLDLKRINEMILIYTFISLVLFTIGIVFLLTGYDIVYMKGRK